MTAKALLAAFVVALACTSVAFAADYSVTTGNGDSSITASPEGMSYSDGQWSGRWVDNQWTPGYWYGNTWHQATWNSDTSDWTVSVSGNDYTLSQDDWDAMPQAPMNGGTPRSTSDVDNARNAEYNGMNGQVKGYSSTRDQGMYNEGNATGASADSDMDRDGDNDNDDHYEGAKCGGTYSGGCGCNKCGSKCGGGCGNKCGSKCGGGCGSKCGSKCGGGCGSKCGGGCGSRCGSKCGGGGCSSCGHSSCDCPGAHYDCWGVSQETNHYSPEDIRDSDYDPVLGDGGRGSHGLFGW